MSSLYNKFMKFCDKKGIKYREMRDEVLLLNWTGDNLNTIGIFIDLEHADDGKVCFKCYSIGKFKDDMFAKGLLTCNSMNAKYRWVRFYVDKDYDVVVDMDAIVDDDTGCEECHELMLRMVNIVDEAYADFMKARFA